MQRTLRFFGISFASVLVAIAVALVQIQEHRSRAQIEVESAHSELELALSTLAVRMASIATAIERAETTSPQAFQELYHDTTPPTTRARERALALMLEFVEPGHATTYVASQSDRFDDAGYPAFNIFPEPPTHTFFPAIFVEPAASRTNVFGYNMGSSEERLSAARMALERGVMTTSTPIVLSQDSGTTQTSFLILYPVYLPEPASMGGALHAVLGAALTPSDLFNEHVFVFDQHIIDIEIEISGVSLPIRLNGYAASEWMPAIPVVTDLVLPALITNGEGFEVPFMASVFIVPTLSDAILPLLAGLATALLLSLFAKTLYAREEARQHLEEALAENEAKLREAYRFQARSQRVEALGRLVGGVAHDFNNILNVILGNLELTKEEKTAGKANLFIDEAISATFRGAHLTRQLLTVGRKSHLQPETVSVAHVLRESTQMLERVLPESIELTGAQAAGLWPIKIDPDGLQNAILNLALNARDALNSQGKLIIEAANTRASQGYLDARPDEEIAPGRYVMISVTDNGPGMRPEVVDRAFEPFFTTKHMTDGSGLGLPSVLGFCRQSGGTCRIYSELGVGTTIKMYLPVSDQTTADQPVSTEEIEDSGPRGRILIAEDEESVARVLVQHLQNAGYTVKRCSTGDAAWDDLAAGSSYDLLISDLVMPGSIQGAELARRVEAERPDIAILLISGYPQEAAIEGNGVAARHVVLTKPIAKDELLRNIKAIIEKHQP